MRLLSIIFTLAPGLAVAAPKAEPVPQEGYNYHSVSPAHYKRAARAEPTAAAEYPTQSVYRRAWNRHEARDAAPAPNPVAEPQAVHSVYRRAWDRHVARDAAPADYPELAVQSVSPQPYRRHVVRDAAPEPEAEAYEVLTA